MQAKARVRETAPFLAERSVQAPQTRIEEALTAHAEGAAASPALQLQNMLIESFSPIEASVRKADKYDVRIRIACILGISAAGWGIIALAIKGLLATIATF